MATSNIDTALERTHEFFRQRQTKEGVLARQLFGSVPADRQLVDHLVRERRRITRMDGSVDGSLIRTAWVAWELLELGCPIDHAAVVRTVGWLLQQQDAGGHAFEGCNKERHQARECHHFVSGLFSPGPRDNQVAPLTLPCGAVIPDEEEARLAASFFALRTVLRAREERRDAVQRHLTSVTTLAEDWTKSPFPRSPDLLLLGVGALAAAPREHRSAAAYLLNSVLELQTDDGEWEGADFFLALEALLALPIPAAMDAISKAAPKLVELQRDSGAFDEDGSEVKAFVALRTLAVVRDLKS